MPMDWDDLNDAVLETFGTSDTVVCHPRGRPSFEIVSAIFDDNHKLISFAEGVEVSTTAPALFVKRGDLPEDFRFDDDDRIQVGAEVYKVADEQADSAGGLLLILNKQRNR